LAPLARDDEAARSRRIAEVKSHYQAAIKIRESLDPKILRGLKQRLSQSYTNLGQVYWNQGQAREADESFLQAEKALTSGAPQVLGPGDNFDIEAATLYLNWSGMLHASQRFDDALARADAGLKRIEPYVRRVVDDPHARRVCLMLHGNRGFVLSGQGNHAESAREWERVIELSDRPIPLQSRVGLWLELAYNGERDRAINYAREVRPSRGVSGDECYNLACLYSVCASVAQDDRRLTSQQRNELVDAHVGDAIRWLEAAAAAGLFKNAGQRDHAKVDPDLKILRARHKEEFRRILESGESKGDRDEPRPAAGR
jgi:tetratricopeptide (TPR) repeat protein